MKNRDGITEYQSDTLKFTRDDVQGFLMKRVDNKKIFHQSNFNKRYFILDFEKGKIIVKKGQKETQIHRTYDLSSIKTCTIATEIMRDTLTRSLSRSRSLINRFKNDSEEQCIWNYCFHLSLSDTDLKLYTPTRIEREHWV